VETKDLRRVAKAAIAKQLPLKMKVDTMGAAGANHEEPLGTPRALFAAWDDLNDPVVIVPLDLNPGGVDGINLQHEGCKDNRRRVASGRVDSGRVDSGRVDNGRAGSQSVSSEGVMRRHFCDTHKGSLDPVGVGCGRSCARRFW
jgi:hypothetical protein